MQQQQQQQLRLKERQQHILSIHHQQKRTNNNPNRNQPNVAWFCCACMSVCVWVSLWSWNSTRPYCTDTIYAHWIFTFVVEVFSAESEKCYNNNNRQFFFFICLFVLALLLLLLLLWWRVCNMHACMYVAINSNSTEKIGKHVSRNRNSRESSKYTV